jgi:phosphopantothenoylcysteine decarboxylase/phosphopantothenate--cysteine ligase
MTGAAPAGASGSRVILGVSGGIAAYKSCELLRLFTEAGHRVRVIPTADALRFVGAATWAALSGEPVHTDVWSDVEQVPHVRLGQTADLVVVAPATADLLARAATGRADDLLTATLLTARCPVLFAPAMHTEMWEHPATRDNVATLRRRGAVVLDPAVGRLTGADSGPGRLPEPEEIFASATLLLDRGALRPGVEALDLAGRHVVVSAGGTREPLDPVRYLGNRSSGRQGYALARTALARGAEVTLVSANVALPDPAGAKVVRVRTAEDLRTAVVAAAADADAVVMAAAVADFRPTVRAERKIKKTGADPEPIALTRNPDVLAEISRDRLRPGQVVVGFAAETDDVLDNGRAKLAAKGCDLLVVNEVGDGLAFGTPDNRATVLGADGSLTEVPHGTKESVAHAVWDLVVPRLPGPRG